MSQVLRKRASGNRSCPINESLFHLMFILYLKVYCILDKQYCLSALCCTKNWPHNYRPHCNQSYQGPPHPASSTARSSVISAFCFLLKCSAPFFFTAVHFCPSLKAQTHSQTVPCLIQLVPRWQKKNPWSTTKVKLIQLLDRELSHGVWLCKHLHKYTHTQ